MTVFELPGFSGELLSGVIFKITEPWPKDVPYFGCLVESSQSRGQHAIILPRDRVLTPEHTSKRFSWRSIILQKTVKQLNDADRMQHMQSVLDV